MPYVCKECTNKTTFSKNVSGRCTYYGRMYVDEDGCYDDDDYDYDDHEETEDEGLECTDCGGNAVEEVDDDEWEAWEGPNAAPKNWKDLLEQRQQRNT